MKKLELGAEEVWKLSQSSGRLSVSLGYLGLDVSREKKGTVNENYCRKHEHRHSLKVPFLVV